MTETTAPVRDSSLEVLIIGPGDCAAYRATQEPSIYNYTLNEVKRE